MRKKLAIYTVWFVAALLCFSFGTVLAQSTANTGASIQSNSGTGGSIQNNSGDGAVQTGNTGTGDTSDFQRLSPDDLRSIQELQGQSLANPPSNSANSDGLKNPLGNGCNDLSCPVNRVIQLLFTIAIPLCAIMVLVGGFQMMTSAGNPEKFGNGRKTLLYAVVGFAVILISGSVATLIQSFFGS